MHYTASTTVGNDTEAGSNANPAAGWVDAGYTTGVSDALTGLTNGTAYRVRVRAWNASGASAWARGTGTPLPTMGFSKPVESVSEGKTKTVTVKLSEALASVTTVRVDIVPDRPATARATETADFMLSTTTLSFPAGTTERTITVRAVADRTTEGAESFFLRLAAPDGAPYRVDETSAQQIFDETEVVIVDASGAPGLEIIARDTVREGEKDTVLVQLGNPAPAGGTAVTLSLGNTGTATEGTDFRLSSKTATIAEGETGVEVTLTALDDSADDNGETVVLKASSTNPAHTAPARIVTIVDNDLPPVPAPRNVKVTPGPRPLTLTVTWEVPAAATIDPDYAVFWSFRKKGAGRGWPRLPGATPEERTARRMTVASSRLSAVPHEVMIWFVYKGKTDPVAAPGVVHTVASLAVIAVGTPRPPVPPSVPRNVQLVPGDAVLTLLWQAPSSVGSFEPAGYQIETAGISPHWEIIHDQIFDWRDPTATRARLKGLVINNEFPQNGNRYSVRIRAWSTRAGAQPEGDGYYPAEDVAYSDWVTVTGTPMTGLSDRPTSLVLTGLTTGGIVTEDVGTVPLTATLNTVALSATTVSLTAGDASTATATDDYTLSAETLTIAAGKRSATATLTVVDDTAVETDEVVHLSAATAGDVVLTSKALAITIADNDQAVAAPDGLTVTPYDGALALVWTAPPGAVSGYDAQYKEAAASDTPATTADDPATGWVDVGHTGTVAWQRIWDLTNGVAYHVRVRAISWTDTASLWTLGGGTPSPLTPLATPANFALTPGDGQITARWDAVANADAYVLLYAVKGSGTFEEVDTGGATAWTVTGLVNGVTYVLAAAAWDTTGRYGVGASHAWLEATPRARKSADANLNALRAEAAVGADGTYAPLALTPADAAGYTATVADAATRLKLTPVAAYAAATVTVDGAAVASGFASAAIALAASGETIIAVRVTAEDGSAQGYTVTVTRLTRDAPTVPAEVTLRALRNTVAEGSKVQVHLALTKALARDVTIPLTVARGTSEDGDHGTLAGITIPAGSHNGVGHIQTAVDGDADDETFTVALDTADLPSGVTAGAPSIIGEAAVTVTITDNGVSDEEYDNEARAEEVQAQTQHTPTPVVTVTAGAEVTEGTAAAFTLTAAPAPGANLAVTVSISQRGNVAQASALGARIVTIPAGAASAAFTVETAAADADESDGAVEVSLGSGAGYTVGDAARAAVAVAAADTPVVIVTAGAAVTEGAPAGFTLTAEPVPAADLAVALSITQSGDVAEASALGTRTVTIPAGSASAAFTVATVDDAADEPDGAIVATLGSGAGYTVGAAGSATVAVADDDEPVPGIVTKRGIAREGTDEAVVFAVRLSRAAPETVTVDYATADGAGAWASTAPARAGADYTATSGTLSFAPGETWKSVAVPILDDAIDEGMEYFLLRFSNPQGATLEARYRETEGLIRNDDHLQAMWLARFGRTVGTQVTDAVSERFEAGLSPGVHATLAGQPLDLSQADDGQALAQTLTGLARAFGAADDPGSGAGAGSFARSHDATGAWNNPADTASVRRMTGRELTLGSSFHLATEGAGSRPDLAAWGRMAHGSFDGEHADDTGRTRVDGEVLTGVLGADADFGRLLAGVAFSLSEGDGTFDSPDADVGARGGIESTMTTVSPYARFRLTERVSAWGLVGIGTGDLTIRFDDGSMDPVRTDTGLDLALRADAFFVRLDSQQAVNTVATEAAASRVRLVLEGGRRFNLGASATLRPSLELGLRHDGGDAETGAGVELGGAVAYADAALGLSIEVRARMLVAHADAAYEEWGASVTARLDPGARGLHAEAGYGLALFGDRVTGTPNLGVALADGGAQDWRIGWRLTPAVSGERGFEVNLDATRRQAAHANGAEHGVMLRGAVRW